MCGKNSSLALLFLSRLRQNRPMKKFLVFLVFLVFASLAMAAPFRSFVITDTALTIAVPAGNFVIIRNFTQEGGAMRAVVTATLTTSSGTTTANVLNAAMIDNAAAAAPSPTPASAIAQPETINVATVAGPATISVPPVSGARLFITYRKESQPDL
jgi:predicted membrane metal-binding protein